MGDNGGSVAILPLEAILTARKHLKLKKFDLLWIIFCYVRHFKHQTRHFRGFAFFAKIDDD